jgi:hypothetical protein
MKYKRIVIVIFLVLVISAPVFALDFIVGAKAGYYGWEPFLKELKGSGFSEIDVGTGVLYGPVFSVLFTPDISLSLAALTGIQSTHWSAQYDPYESYYLAATYFFESRRTDVDSALSYRIMQNLKVFLGYKYQYIKSTIQYTELRTDAAKLITEINLFDLDAKALSHGPALGIGYSLPLGKSFFVTANLSGLYMWGYFEGEGDFQYNYSAFDTWTPVTPMKFKIDTRQFGVNLEPAVGFSAGESGLIFTLGFRYQWLRTEFLEEHEPGEKIRDANDYLYGVFVSVLYTF